MVVRQPRLNGREIDAVLIDAGGVLVDPNWETVASVLGRHGIHADPADLASADPFLKRELDDAELIRGSTDLMWRERWLARLLRHAGMGMAGTDSALDAATDELEAMHLERGIWEVVAEGVPEALDTLRGAGLRLSLASNAEPLLRRKLAELNLADRFDHLAISGEVGIEKPDPRFFLGAVEALGVAPQRAIHVGDLFEVDVVGARSAGIEAVLVDVADLSSDREVTRIRSLAELPALLGIGGSRGVKP
jgi:HAD superfamily hydrolase (TIGR01549 family)